MIMITGLFAPIKTGGSSKGLCKEKKLKKSEITTEVGGLVVPGLTRNFFFLENRPKIPYST